MRITIPSYERRIQARFLHTRVLKGPGIHHEAQYRFVSGYHINWGFTPLELPIAGGLPILVPA